MAERRMFSNNIINSAKFLMMPNEAQNLYFHLGMRADDDGVVEGFTVLRQTGINQDNLKLLAMKGFIKVLNDELVTFITDWTEHNKIRADRKKDSIYKELLLQVCPQLELKEPKQRADRKSGTSHGQPKDGIGKVRLGKDSIGEYNTTQSVSRVDPLYNKIMEITGLNLFQIQNVLTPIKLKDIDIDIVIKEIDNSKFLQEQKGMTGFRKYFSTIQQINKIAAGYYQDEKDTTDYDIDKITRELEEKMGLC